MRRRQRTGEGQLVSTSLLRTGAYILGWDLSLRLRLGRLDPPYSRRAVPNPLINCYRSGDGKWFWLLGLQADRHWPDLVRAVERPELISEIAEEFGTQCCVVAIDARRTEMGFEVFTHGGRTPTGIDALGWAKRAEELGAGEILLTSMDRDGTKQGFDIDLTRAMTDSRSIPVIASGGVGTLDDLVEGVLMGGADAVLAASIFHFGEHSVAEAKAAMAAAGITVRPV